jgi:RecQ-mediated genome instability protein 1
MPPHIDPNLTTQLSANLLAKYYLQISPAYLITLLTSLTNSAATNNRPLPPVPALVSTVHFRLLNSDFTTSLLASDPSCLFPSGVADVNVKERRLQGDIPVQVLNIVDVGTSRWSQVEAIERVERGEEIKGREIVRTVPGVADGDEEEEGNGRRGTAGEGSVTATTSRGQSNGSGSTGKRSQGPHRLILQDAKKNIVTAFELGDIPKIFIGDNGEGMFIGCKLVLKAGTLVRRGMVMLQPENVVVLGGKIESWDTKWREDRKKRLIADTEEEQEARRNER